MRRRARFLRKARELAYRDLGGLVFNLHRFGERNDPLVSAKLSTLSRIDGELRTLDLVNGKSIEAGSRRRRAPLVTEGEFGILLGSVLGPKSEAFFTWSRWETLRGKRLAVFDFSVDKQHSTLSLNLSDLVKAVAELSAAPVRDAAMQ